MKGFDPLDFQLRFCSSFRKIQILRDILNGSLNGKLPLLFGMDDPPADSKRKGLAIGDLRKFEAEGPYLRLQGGRTQALIREENLSVPQH